jgi:alpha-methylacyl-CoA racemase
MSGPLSGFRIIELAGMGPAPFAAMSLADAGADIIRVDRHIDSFVIDDDPLREGRAMNILNRGRRSITLDLKDAAAAKFVLRLIERADALIEGYRPGVTERLGIGADTCTYRNPRLVYGRVTGWGRIGQYSPTAGHDINYVGLSGVLGSIGHDNEIPTPPLNLLGDFAGGGLLLAYGVTCALLERSNSNRGQVVDVSMVDGVAYLSTYLHGLRAQNRWNDERESNVLDGASPYYRTYKTLDGQFMAVGAIEDRFYRIFLDQIGLSKLYEADRFDPAHWPHIAAALEETFLQRTRSEWEQVFIGVDACVSPVLSLGEASQDEELRNMGTFIVMNDIAQPAPTPRFSRTSSSIDRPAPSPGQGGLTALQEWGIPITEINQLLDSGVLIAHGD